jgi:alanine racemase
MAALPARLRFSAFPATILRHKARMTAPATLTVDLDALSHNFHALEAITGVAVHPVVKADSYGLGAVPVTRRLIAEGARTFFVARLAEGLTLRTALGAEPTIYVLDGCVGEAAAELKAANLRPILNHGNQLATWTEAGGGDCGLQIDTGMNRLGFRVEDAPEPFDRLRLVMSHLACSDEPAQPMNQRQRDAFTSVSARYPDALKSFANSGGCFLGPDYAFDAVRPGICLYGGGPEGRADSRLKAVATLTAEVLQVRDLPAGESVGYSRGFVAPATRRIATCGAGYADGVLRSHCPNGKVWVAGALRPILGRVSMDVIAIDVTDADVSVGDRVEIFGTHRPVDDAAAAAGTIAYELLTSVTVRVARSYV